MKLVYPAIFFLDTSEHEESYIIDIPDINSATEGYGLYDAIYMARDLIGCVLFDTPDDKIPKSTPIKEISVNNSTFAKYNMPYFVQYVDIDLKKYRREQRRNIKLVIVNTYLKIRNRLKH